MQAKKQGDTIEISFQYDPRLVEMVRSLDGRKYNASKKNWAIPVANSRKSLMLLQRYGFRIDPALVEAVEGDAKKVQEAAALALLPDTEFASPLPLFPYQRVGAAFLLKSGSAILGDQCGLGKTIQTLATVEAAKANKILIFCPSAVKYQWGEEIKKFIKSDESFVVIDGNKKERDEQWKSDKRFYIANYELLLRDFEVINERTWDYILADEATKISNARAKQSKAIKKLKAKNRIAMTGTPISNRAEEVWNVVDFCIPGALGNYWSFLSRYCVKNRFGGIFAYQNLDELNQKLKRYMIRREKKNVLLDLPELILTDVPFKLSEEEHELYGKIKKEILFEIEQTDISKIENPMTIQMTLVKMTRLQQLTDSMELIGEQQKSSKLDVLKELLQENVVNGDKAIVFSRFSEMCKILGRELKEYNPLIIIGETSNEERHKIIDAFNTDDEHKILVLSSAGQYGLNIQRANILFHYDQEWSLAKMVQREGRAHRIGQKKVVQVFNLLARGTMDMYVKKTLHGKAELSEGLLGNRLSTMEEIKEALMYEEKD